MKVSMNGDFVDNKTSEEQLLWHEGEGEPATGSGQKWERKANGWSGKETKLVNWILDCLFDLGVGHFGTR